RSARLRPPSCTPRRGTAPGACPRVANRLRSGRLAAVRGARPPPLRGPPGHPARRSARRTTGVAYGVQKLGVERTPPPRARSRRMPHILIVEDDPTTSWALAEGLSDDGYTIDTFRTAEEALVWLKSHRSDLVITDFRLPGLSGLELAQKLSRGRHAQPVIVVTAYGSPETVRELVRAGVCEVVPKPFHVDELRRAVHRALLARPERRGKSSRGTRPVSGSTPLRKAA